MIDPQPTPQPLPAERVLELAAPMLAGAGGEWRPTDDVAVRAWDGRGRPGSARFWAL